jgi:hypothetical protein
VAVAGGIGLRVTGNGQITLTNSIINGVFGTGIVIASGSASVQHCIVANCSQDGIEATDPTISNVNNCIFYECKNAIAKQTADGSSTADYNNIWYVVKEGYTRYRNTVAGAHDQSIYPKFIKADWGFPNTGDFSLPAGELLLRLGMSGSAMGLNNPLKIGVNLE